MEDYDVQIEDEDQFWDELEDVVSTPCKTHERIDDTLRTWISLTTTYRERYVTTEAAMAQCALALLHSDLFKAHDDYIRRQLVHGLLQEDDPPTIHLMAALLLYDGKQTEATLELMCEENAFARLVELLKAEVNDDLDLDRLLLELLYETARIQRLRYEDLSAIDDAFILYLFQIVESLSSDVNDPYHYHVIRVLLVLNEQYMVATNDPSQNRDDGPSITNRVIKTLSIHGGSYKTFGENIILLLNRETETSHQLLILKLFYLIFTTTTTREYFYTNDLYVLVDILIRNLLDLPAFPSTSALRHTYLRVLHPLLAFTQLRNPPHYKRPELRKMLHILANVENSHFAPADETTVRLVGRCLGVDWIVDKDEDAAILNSTTTTTQSISSIPEIRLPNQDNDKNNTENEITESPTTYNSPTLTITDEETSEETKVSTATPPSLDSLPTNAPTAADVARKHLGISIPSAQASNLSFADVVAAREKPGVITPSRQRGNNVPPEPPPARRRGSTPPEPPKRRRAGKPLVQRKSESSSSGTTLREDGQGKEGVVVPEERNGLLTEKPVRSVSLPYRSPFEGGEDDE